MDLRSPDLDFDCLNFEMPASLRSRRRNGIAADGDDAGSQLRARSGGGPGPDVATGADSGYASKRGGRLRATEAAVRRSSALAPAIVAIGVCFWYLASVLTNASKKRALQIFRFPLTVVVGQFATVAGGPTGQQ